MCLFTLFWNSMLKNFFAYFLHFCHFSCILRLKMQKKAQWYKSKKTMCFHFSFLPFLYEIRNWTCIFAPFLHDFWNWTFVFCLFSMNFKIEHAKKAHVVYTPICIFCMFLSLPFESKIWFFWTNIEIEHVCLSSYFCFFWHAFKKIERILFSF